MIAARRGTRGSRRASAGCRPPQQNPPDGTRNSIAEFFAWRGLSNPRARCSPRAESISRACAGRSVKVAPRAAPHYRMRDSPAPSPSARGQPRSNTIHAERRSQPACPSLRRNFVSEVSLCRDRSPQVTARPGRELPPSPSLVRGFFLPIGAEWNGVDLAAKQHDFLDALRREASRERIKMPIRRYAGNGVVFTPEALSAMNNALADTAEILGIGSDENKRQAVARFIIRVASEDGNLDGNTLRDRAVRALGGVSYCDVHLHPAAASNPSRIAE
jgi:hypothetical protein